MLKQIDINLIERCVENDRRSHNELYRLLFSYLMNICMRYKTDEAQAGSALNAIFLKIINRLSDFDVSKPILPWVKTIAINTLIDEYRSNQKIREVSFEDEYFLESSDANLADVQMSADDLISMIRELPATMGEVFNLFAIDGFPHKDIANMMGIKEVTSRWYLNKAREQLRMKIELENQKSLRTRAL